MKRLLVGVLGVVSMATSASAADLAARPYTKAPPMAVSPAYNWSGFYIGGNVGYGFGRADEDSSSALVAGPVLPPGFIAPFTVPAVTVPFASSTRTPVDGVLGGGQIGYNAQFGRWILGIEADIQATDQKRNTTTFASFGGVTPFPPPFIGFTAVTGTQTETVNTRLDWFGTVRGRVGFTTGATGDLMWYGTGGYAYGQFKTSVTQFTSATVITPCFPSRQRLPAPVHSALHKIEAAGPPGVVLKEHFGAPHGPGSSNIFTSISTAPISSSSPFRPARFRLPSSRGA
jgi:outer membrane immunogenic protein